MPAAHWRALYIRKSIWAIAKLDCRYHGSRPAIARWTHERLKYSLSLTQEFGWTDLCLAGRNPPEAF